MRQSTKDMTDEEVIAEYEKAMKCCEAGCIGFVRNQTEEGLDTTMLNLTECLAGALKKDNAIQILLYQLAVYGLHIAREKVGE